MTGKVAGRLALPLLQLFQVLFADLDGLLWSGEEDD